jgi:hypothetical protein
MLGLLRRDNVSDALADGQLNDVAFHSELEHSS